jgi:hypothetical protein
MRPGIFRVFELVLIAGLLSGCGQQKAPVYEARPQAAEVPLGNTAGLPRFLSLAQVDAVSNSLKCERRFSLEADPYRVSRMRGFYCLSGPAANFRILKIYESAAAARSDVDLYTPIQTGGRKVFLMGNWFLFGLESDARAIKRLALKPASSSSEKIRFRSRQDICMGLISGAIDLTFSKVDDPRKLVASAENLFPGANHQIERAISKNSWTLQRAYSSQVSAEIEQQLAKASSSYLRFCLAQ